MTDHVKPTSVVIVGAGITGLSTAIHLAEKNVEKILIIDKGRIGAGSSQRAGAISTMLMATETATRFRGRSMEILAAFDRILEEYTFHQSGCLALYSRDQYEAILRDHDMHRRAGGDFEVLGPRDIERRFPDLQISDSEVGVLDFRGGWSEPDVYIPSLTAKVRDLGVEIHEHDGLDGFVIERGRVRGVRTQRLGEVRCDAVVCTVNAWANQVLSGIGRPLPFKNFVHERFVTFPFDRPPNLPATNDQANGTYVRPTEDNRLLMGTGANNPDEFLIPRPDFNLDDLRPDPRSLAYLKEVMADRVPMFRGMEFDAHRVGLISVAMDGEPVVGPVGDLPGLYLAVNFSSGGFGHHPAAGSLLAEWIVDGQTSMDISEFSPDRFTAGARDDFLAKRMSHHEMWASTNNEIYRARPVIRRH